MNNSADAAASPLEPVVGLTGIAALEAEMADRLAAKNTDIERLRAINAELFERALAHERTRAVNAELLAALEELIGYFPTSTTKPPVELLKQGRAAIAKARGETP